MDLGVIEVVVNTRRNAMLALLRVVLIVLAVAGLLLGTVIFWPFLIAAVICGIGAYIADLYSLVDYEYSLVDNELRIARILKKEKRKHLGSYDLTRLEILAAETSYQLDSYKKNTRYKTVDCSDHTGNAQSNWQAYIDGKDRLVLTIDSEEGERLIRCIRQFAPSKVILVK